MQSWKRLSVAWKQMSEVLSVPHTEAEYRRVSAFLDLVVDEVGEDDSHPLAALIETLGALIDAYEREHVAEPAGSPVQVLRMLMDDHGLSPSRPAGGRQSGSRVGGSSRQAADQRPAGAGRSARGSVCPRRCSCRVVRFCDEGPDAFLRPYCMTCCGWGDSRSRSSPVPSAPRAAGRATIARC